MKIAVYYPDKFPAFSIKIYTDILIEELEKMGVTFVKFTNFETINQDLDLIWDPQTGGGNPTFLDKKYNVPTVITMHGAALFSLPIKDNIYKLKTALRIILNRNKNKIKWGNEIDFIDKIISVSEFGKSEAIKYLDFPEKRITPIYHGVDFEFFKPKETKRISEIKTFLHISQFQPVKNIPRLISAFLKAKEINNNIRLKIISPGYPYKKEHEAITIIKYYISREQVKIELQNSYAFILPSFRETFGMPILEAMASNTPVITSNTSACAEVSGSSALLINPYNISEITEAILELAENKNLYLDLQEKGMKKTKQFTWEKSAKEHLILFKSLIKS